MKRSLHVGINDYPGTGSDLSGCVNDAVDWAIALKKRGFDDQVMLLDNQASKKPVLDAIEKIVTASGRDDLTVITYSGHGTWVPDEDGDEADGRDEALCPWDIGTTGEIITDDELYEIFAYRKRGARIVVVSDSCHSGSVSRMVSADGPLAGNKQFVGYQTVRFLPPSFHLTGDRLKVARRVERTPSRNKIKAATVLFSGCRDSEYSYDAYFNMRPNGAMSFVALWCLDQMQSGSTYYDWYKTIRKYLPQHQYPQTPQLSCSYAQRKWGLFEE